MTLDEISKFIATVGFPVFVAAILLVRIDRGITALIAEIHSLKQLLEKHYSG